MAWRDLREALAALADDGRLVEVTEELSPRYELAAFLSLAAREQAAAFLFTRVAGHAVPVVANVVHDRDVVALAMGVEPDQVVASYGERLQQPLAPRPVDPDAESAPVLAETVRGADLDLATAFPVLTHYEADAGPYLTTGLASMRDPDTGAVERSICRMQVRGPDRIGLAFVNPPLGTLWRRVAERGRALPVAVAVGLEPLTFLAAALPPMPGTDKLAAAGGLRREPVDVVPGPDTGLPVPARAEILIEGELETGIQPDGPLGEISGYYLSFPETPTLRITRVSHRPAPLYHALLPTGPEGDALLSLVVEASMAPHLRTVFPFVLDLTFVPGSFGASLVVRVRHTERTRVRGLLYHILSLDRVKKVVAVADDVDPADAREVEWSVVTRCQPDADVIVVDDMRGHPIDPSCHEGLRTARMGIDATGFERVKGEGKVSFPASALARARAAVEGSAGFQLADRSAKITGPSGPENFGTGGDGSV